MAEFMFSITQGLYGNTMPLALKVVHLAEKESPCVDCPTNFFPNLNHHGTIFYSCSLPNECYVKIWQQYSITPIIGGNLNGLVGYQLMPANNLIFHFNGSYFRKSLRKKKPYM